MKKIVLGIFIASILLLPVIENASAVVIPSLCNVIVTSNATFPIKCKSIKDTLYLEPGSNIQMSVNPTTKKIRISSTGGGVGNVSNATQVFGTVDRILVTTVDGDYYIDIGSNVELKTSKDQANGYAGLDSNGKIPKTKISATGAWLESELPTISKVKISTTGAWAQSEIPVLSKSKIALNGTWAEADIPTLSKSKISTTGTWVEADIPSLSKGKISSSGTWTEAEIPTLSKGKISSSGTWLDTDIPTLAKSKISNTGAWTEAEIPSLSKSKISSSGAWTEAEIPTLSKSKISGTGAWSESDIPTLSKSKISTTGTWAESDIPSISKIKVSDSGTWEESEIPTLAKTKISSSGTFSWNEISKSGSVLGDLGNVQGTCAQNEVLKYDVVSNRWNCGSDVSGAMVLGDKGDITVSGTGDTWEIDNQTIPYYKIQNVTTNTLLGRVTSGTGSMEEISPTTVTSILNLFTSSLKGLVPASGGGTSTFLRADGNWATPVDNQGVVSINSDTSATHTIQGTSNKIVVVTTGGVTTLNTGSDVELNTNKGAANGYASLDANTRIPTVQLGTGTASASNFLRGDGSWATPTDTTGITSINSDTSVSQTIQGTTGKVTVSTTGGVTTINTGDTVELNTNKDQANGYAGLDSSAKLAKTKVSTTGTWAESDIPTLSKTKISSSGTFPWGEISKTGSSLGDMADVPDVCEQDEILKYDTVTSAWYCTTDVIVNGDKGDITVSLNGMDLAVDQKAITYSKIQDVSATNRLLGRISTGSGTVEEVTGTQATSLLDLFTSTLKGLVPASGGGTTTYLRADGTWATPPDTTGITSINSDSSSSQTIQGTTGKISVSTTGGVTTINTGNTVELNTNKGVASGYASLDTNTRVPTGQLGTGAASASNFLRGDGSWATPVDTTGITSINSDSSASQTIQGTTNKITVSTTGGVTTLNTGTSVELNTNKGVASGYASLDTNTRVPTAQLGTGAASSSNFLRGDGSWSQSVSDTDKGDITVSSSGTVYTVDPKTITYSKIQDVSATNRFLGRISTGAGSTEELTGTQATTLLDTFSSTLKGLAPASGGGTTNFLRADGTWAVPPAPAGSGILTINGLNPTAQTIAGTTNYLTVTSSGSTHTLNIGANVVTTDGSAQTIAKGLTFNSGNLLLRNPANTFSYTVTPSAITAARTLNLPLTTQTETLAVQPQKVSVTSSAPTGTTSLTGVMTGLGSTCVITPRVTGNLFIIVTGQGNTNTGDDGWKADLRYGTGTAPTNGGALAGTVLQAGLTGSGVASGNTVDVLTAPITLQGIATGLTVGTAYWIDIGQYAVTGGTASFTNIRCTAFEM